MLDLLISPLLIGRHQHTLRQCVCLWPVSPCLIVQSGCLHQLLTQTKGVCIHVSHSHIQLVNPPVSSLDSRLDHPESRDVPLWASSAFWPVCGTEITPSQSDFCVILRTVKAAQQTVRSSGGSSQGRDSDHVTSSNKTKNKITEGRKRVVVFASFGWPTLQLLQFQFSSFWSTKVFTWVCLHLNTWFLLHSCFSLCDVRASLIDDPELWTVLPIKRRNFSHQPLLTS